MNTRPDHQSVGLSCGNQVLGMIRRNITYKDKSLIVPLWTDNTRNAKIKGGPNRKCV